MDNQQRDIIFRQIFKTIQSLLSETTPWVKLADLGNKMNEHNIPWKQLGHQNLKKLLYDYKDILEIKEETPEGKPPIYYVRPKSTYINTDTITVNPTQPNTSYEASAPLLLPNTLYPLMMTPVAPPIPDPTVSKPLYQNNKSALMALGFITNINGALNHLAGMIGSPVNQYTLESNLKQSYDKGNILYFHYDKSGNAVPEETFSDETTIVFAVNTLLQDKNGNDIYAQYNKTPRGWTGVYFNTENQLHDVLNTYRIGNLSFKNYAQANAFISDLQSNLLPDEIWKHTTPANNGLRPKTKYDILESYLATVLAALVQDYDRQNSPNAKKIKFSKNSKYALFNTGLLSKYATDILIVGETNSKEKDTLENFSLFNPLVVTNGLDELFSKDFKAEDTTVDMFTFYTSTTDIIYDATLKIDMTGLSKLSHCIDDGIKKNRFPQEYNERYKRGDIETIMNDFKTAITRAERIAKRNYKYIVPQYRIDPKGNTIQFLMPIYISQQYDKSPDFALVLSKQENNGQKFYKPETVLELSWAYSNARVLCKPDSSWLTPKTTKEKIVTKDTQGNIISQENIIKDTQGNIISQEITIYNI